MSPRRRLKKDLAQWRHYASALPRLIECSRVYGDYTYSEADLEMARHWIRKIEAEISRLPVLHK